MTARHYHRVKESELAPWLAIGWTEVYRDRIPSVSENIVLIECKQDPAPIPIEHEDFGRSPDKREVFE